MTRNDFDSDLDGFAKYLMSERLGLPISAVRFPEPPPPDCHECGEPIDVNDYDNPMPTECRSCAHETFNPLPHPRDIIRDSC